jgi:hypothetical protein
MKKAIFYFVAFLMAGFGVLTLYLSTSVIFDLFGVREKEGNFVFFVVWANFISSIIYLLSVFGLLTLKKWTYKVLGISAVLLVITFVAFQFHIQSGGIYENKTSGALIFRSALTLVFTLFAYFTIDKKTIK